MVSFLFVGLAFGLPLGAGIGWVLGYERGYLGEGGPELDAIFARLAHRNLIYREALTAIAEASDDRYPFVVTAALALKAGIKAAHVDAKEPHG